MPDPTPERKTYEAASADLAAAAARLQSAKELRQDLRRQLNKAECECSNALTEWEKRKDALLKVIEAQGAP